MTPMNAARTGHGAVLFQNKIFVVGGKIGNTYDKTVEAYDFENGQWSPKASLNKAKAYFGVRHNFFMITVYFNEKKIAKLPNI